MRTTFKDILDRAYTTLFTDYKLDELAKIDEQAFYDFLGGMLVNACDIFDGHVLHGNASDNTAYYNIYIYNYAEQPLGAVETCTCIFGVDVASGEKICL